MASREVLPGRRRPRHVPDVTADETSNGDGSPRRNCRPTHGCREVMKSEAHRACPEPSSDRRSSTGTTRCMGLTVPAAARWTGDGKGHHDAVTRVGGEHPLVHGGRQSPGRLTVLRDPVWRNVSERSVHSRERRRARCEHCPSCGRPCPAWQDGMTNRRTRPFVTPACGDERPPQRSAEDGRRRTGLPLRTDADRRASICLGVGGPGSVTHGAGCRRPSVVPTAVMTHSCRARVEHGTRAEGADPLIRGSRSPPHDVWTGEPHPGSACHC